MSLRFRSNAPELMDGADVPDAVYAQCLADLAAVNRLTLTHRPTLRWLARNAAGLRSGDAFSLLDVACGQGDFLRTVHQWAVRRGLVPNLTGIDRNPRSTDEARRVTSAAMPIRYLTADVFSYEPSGRSDWIVSSQFTHHLSNDDVVHFIRWMEVTAVRGWYISDLERHWFSYYGFRLLCRVAGWHPMVRHDGAVSIARSFRRPDWQQLLARAPVAAAIESYFPFRLCVARSK